MNFNHYKVHSTFVTHNKQMKSYWKASLHMILYDCAVCSIPTVSGEWLQDPCTQGYVNIVINLVLSK